jgi:hypothetical protein
VRDGHGAGQEGIGREAGTRTREMKAGLCRAYSHPWHEMCFGRLVHRLDERVFGGFISLDAYLDIFI